MRRVLVAMAVVSCVSGGALGDIPQVVGYQGRVTDNAGVPVADGTYDMRFQIYNNSGGSGSPLWDSGTHSEQVTDGIFNVLLGDTPHPALNLAFDQDYWLAVTFDGEVQVPLKRLGSTGYAYMASGLVLGTVVAGKVTTGPNAAVAGMNTATTGVNYGLYGAAASTAGWAVYGEATAASGMACGVAGVSAATDGRGVFGNATANSGGAYGLYGMTSSTGGHGVFGSAVATTGSTIGVLGRSMSPSGLGVCGEAEASYGSSSYGVYGSSASTAGKGVYGWATASTGGTYGVYGESSSWSGIGVYGSATASAGDTEGVYGRCASTDFGAGVYGRAAASTGYGRGGSFTANSPDGVGVHANASAMTGNTWGVYGQSWSAGGIGVYGWNNAGGYGAYCTGNFGVSGTKSCVVRTRQGPTLLYCQESPECWFEDFGEGRLVNGTCHVELDPLFLETVTIDAANPMKVFVQLHDRACEGVAVEKSTTGFDVIELKDGTSNGTFDYRVVAKRAGFEEKRLDHSVAAPKVDPYLYPEVQEKLLRERQEELARLEQEEAQMGLERARAIERAALLRR